MDFAIIIESIDLNLAIELEGFDKDGNGGQRTRWQHDHFNGRIQALMESGWKILTITNSQFSRDPSVYIMQIKTIITQASERVKARKELLSAELENSTSKIVEEVSKKVSEELGKQVKKPAAPRKRAPAKPTIDADKLAEDVSARGTKAIEEKTASNLSTAPGVQDEAAQLNLPNRVPAPTSSAQPKKITFRDCGNSNDYYRFGRWRYLVFSLE